MGVGVAQSLAQAGHEVVLIDLTEERLAAAYEEISQNLRLHRLLRASAAEEDIARVLERVHTTTEYGRLDMADFVVENVTEKWESKAAVYGRLEEVCPNRCIYCVNTSAFPITRIAALTRRPAHVVGTHFMNPVPLKTTVEVIRGQHTSADAMERVQALLASLGKQWIIVGDVPGFVTNRVLMVTINEAIFLVQDCVAAAADVDALFRSCFGHKMGPLETADLIGLDTVLYSLEVLHESYNDGKYRPCPLLIAMVADGHHGRKSGRGFYSYAS